MATPSAAISSRTFMSVVYFLTVALVYIISSPPTDSSYYNVAPLQQYQSSRPNSFVRSILADVWSIIRNPSAILGLINGSRYFQNVSTVLGRPPTTAQPPSREIIHAKELLHRQRLRAIRHADAMRLETLHFLRLMTSTIPLLRRSWRGEDFCVWEGVICREERFTLSSLINVSTAARYGADNNWKHLLAEEEDGEGAAGDIVVVLVELRLRGMQLYGYFPDVRPVGSMQYASPLQSALAAAQLTDYFVPRSKRNENRRRLPITSPREEHYWPWEAMEMKAYTRLEHNARDMVRGVLSRVLHRLELRGTQNNHSDLQLPPGAVRLEKDDTVPFASPANMFAPSGSLGGLLPQLTRYDVSQIVFGEVESRLLAVYRVDISNNPGVIVTYPITWLFPFIEAYNAIGTTARPAALDMKNKGIALLSH